jgi:hypothetical protein
MRTYKAYLEQLHIIQENYDTSRAALQASPRVQNLGIDDFIETINNFSDNRTTFLDEIQTIKFHVRSAIRDGINFNSRDPQLPNLNQLLRRFQSQLRGLVP